MRLLWFALALTLSGGAVAQQQQGNKVRLDEFALPVSAAELRVEQVEPQSLKLQPMDEAPDRQLTVPGPSAVTSSSSPIVQLSPAGQGPSADQLTQQSESLRIAPATVSSSADSRPGAVSRIGGEDRCDPHRDGPKPAAACERILERRAAQFSATEAPRLSPEQELLAMQRQTEPSQTSLSEMRSRMAKVDPHAERRSSQEVASLYLDRPPHNTGGGLVPDRIESSEALAQVLQGLQIIAPDAGQR